MITTNFYLDTRAVGKNKPAPLKISITKHGVTSYIPLGVKILTSQWNKEEKKVKDHPSKTTLNNYIYSEKNKIDNVIIKLQEDGMLTHLTSNQVRKLILEKISPEVKDENLFLNRFKRYMSTRKAANTVRIYLETLRNMMAYDKNLSSLTFEQITKDWLVGFDKYLTDTNKSHNTRSTNFRNIRAVFNDAIDNDITSFYPFRKFMVREIPTRKRAYDVDTLRRVFEHDVPPQLEKFLDIFKLIFFLIGINITDLFNLKCIENGRIKYTRAKTGKLYDIKVEPEALEIINKYRGKERLLNLSENYSNVHSFMFSINTNLQRIGKYEYVKISKTQKHIVYHPEFPDLTTYVARHSWATIAYELDIPNETIAAALGHSSGNPTTAIYIRPNNKKVDEANRKVLDYVLYGKK